MIGVLVVGLAVLAVVAGRLGLSPVPLYLLAGLMLGPGGPFQLEEVEGFIEVGAEVAAGDPLVVVSAMKMEMTLTAPWDGVVREVTDVLRDRRSIRAGEDDDFSVLDTKEIANALSSTTEILTLLLGAVAAVSLLVGGIGIMNIMLVSVTERTREIGIRMSIGALPREVLLQFLVEALVLCLLGGTVGILAFNRPEWAISCLGAMAAGGAVTDAAGVAPDRYVYYPGTEELQPDEIRVIACGTGMPNARPKQAAACWLVELGNGDKFLFDLGSGSAERISALQIPYTYLDKVFIGHLHGDHFGSLGELFIGGGIMGRQVPLRVWGPSGAVEQLGPVVLLRSTHRHPPKLLLDKRVIE